MSKSIDDVMGNTIFLDLQNVILCFLVMYIYTSVMLNGSSWSSMRFFLTAIGLFSVLLGVTIANGLTSAIGYEYMPHFAILPFLMVGLGIDDMFVIMKVYRNLDGLKESDIESKIGLTLRHAGVAISVTSLTDICAFAVGAITVFPALQAFCVACSLGIAAIYVLQLTWFVAWLVVDEKRRQKQTSYCNEVVGKCQEKLQLPFVCTSTKFNISEKLWPSISRLLDFKAYHSIIIAIGIGCLGIGIWGCCTIRQEIDLSRFYPSDSYLSKWANGFNEHFQDWELGFSIYTQDLSTKEDFIRLDEMTKQLSSWIEDDLVLDDMDNWWRAFNFHIKEYWNITDWKTLYREDGNPMKYADDKDLQHYISEFLYSPNGGTYISNLRFNGTLNCKQSSPSITVSAIPISYIKDDDPSLGNYKRKILDNFISSLNNDSSHKKIFSYGVYYFVWDLNEHVRFELWRNLGVAMLCILVVTLLLLNNFTACTLVNVSVIMTVVNVVGFVRFWDISIDVVSLCTIVVVVGICVDYPVHIIHCYLVSTGNSFK